MVDPALRDIVTRFSNVTVLVVGDVMLDEYILGTVQRISPEAPVPVVEIEEITRHPGGAANAAANIVTLGGNVRLISVIGDDQTGQQLCDAIRFLGFGSAGLVKDGQRSTTKKTRIVAGDRQLLRMDDDWTGRISQDMEWKLQHYADKRFPDINACLISDYGKGVITADIAFTVIKTSLSKRAPVVVDPCGDRCDKYGGATVIKPNVRELECITGHTPGSLMSLEDAGRKLERLLPGTRVLVTCDDDGMRLIGTPECVYLPTTTKTVVDTIGVDDTIAATLVLALATGADMLQASVLAGLAAGIAASKAGAQPPHKHELLALLTEDCQ